jgi:predicted HTH transcriptional regulator
MSTETTPAIERGVEALRDRSDAYDPDELVVHAVLAAALDIEEMAHEIAQAELHDYEDVWTSLDEMARDGFRRTATAVRTALLGEETR